MSHQESKPTAPPKSGMSTLGYMSVLLIGMFLGVLFVKSEVASWKRVHDMFLFQEAHMYLIICTAIVVAAISMLLIKKFEVKSVDGTPIRYQPKPFHSGVVLGGALFGAGWAITGACPGPIYAQIGVGEWMAWFTLVGAIAGMFAYAATKSKLPH